MHHDALPGHDCLYTGCRLLTAMAAVVLYSDITDWPTRLGEGLAHGTEMRRCLALAACQVKDSPGPSTNTSDQVSDHFHHGCAAKHGKVR